MSHIGSQKAVVPFESLATSVVPFEEQGKGTPFSNHTQPITSRTVIIFYEKTAYIIELGKWNKNPDVAFGAEDLLKAAWGKIPTPQIAEMLGFYNAKNQPNKNAIIGKAHKLHLKKLDQPLYRKSITFDGNTYEIFPGQWSKTPEQEAGTEKLLRDAWGKMPTRRIAELLGFKNSAGTPRPGIIIDRARELGLPVLPSDHLREQMIIELEKGTPKTRIVQLFKINRMALWRLERKMQKEYAGLDDAAVQNRLRQVLNGVLEHENKSVAAERLELNPNFLFYIRHGLQDVPINNEAKNWASAIEMYYADNETWQNHRTEFRQLMIYARSLLLEAQTSPKKAKIAQPAITGNITEFDITVVGAAVHWIRQEHGDTPADFIMQTQDNDLTPLLLGAIETGNKNVKPEIYLRTADHACRIYGADAWDIAQNKRHEEVSRPSRARQVPAALTRIAA